MTCVGGQQDSWGEVEGQGMAARETEGYESQNIGVKTRKCSKRQMARVGWRRQEKMKEGQKKVGYQGAGCDKASGLAQSSAIQVQGKDDPYTMPVKHNMYTSHSA